METKTWHKWTYLWNQNRITGIEKRLVVVKEEWIRGGMELEIGVSRCGFLYVDWIRSKALLYGTENHIQYAMIKHNGKVLKKLCIYKWITESLCYLAVNELWCWRRLLRVPWTARRSNQSILKEISPGCSLEGLMLKLKLQYFGHLMRRADSLEKTLMLGKIEGRRRRGWQRMRWLDGMTDSMDLGLGKVGDGQGGLVCFGSWGNKESDTTEQLNWTEELTLI